MQHCTSVASLSGKYKDCLYTTGEKSLELPLISHVKNENPMSEPMKVALGVFHRWPVAMKYPWNAFIGHE